MGVIENLIELLADELLVGQLNLMIKLMSLLFRNAFLKIILLHDWEYALSWFVIAIFQMGEVFFDSTLEIVQIRNILAKLLNFDVELAVLLLGVVHWSQLTVLFLLNDFSELQLCW